jgi:two-component system chemotaxis response regulator CheB
MSHQYYIAILAEHPLADEYVQALSRNTQIKILFTTSQPSDVFQYYDAKKPHAGAMTVIFDAFKPDTHTDFIRMAKNRGIPVLALVSSVKRGFSLLAEGASEMMVRPESEPEPNAFFYKMLTQNIEKIAAEYAEKKRQPDAVSGVRDKIVAIGASTGGTETVLQILKELPADGPPVLVVQHMPAVFTKLYAERADTLCPMHVLEARNGDHVANGRVLIAPGDYHMTLVREGAHFKVLCDQGERVHGQRPSVDVLFDSVAKAAAADAVGVILTGMGADGAKGLLHMRNNGAYTIGQDESTSIVYGMPRAAYEMGAVAKQLPIEDICEEILTNIKK